MNFCFVSGLRAPLQIIIFIISLALGAFCLVKFCDIFLDSSSTIAKKFKISPLIIGLTIVAIGTSFPEFAVSVSDSIAVAMNGGNANIAFSNVVGSNVSNLLLVLSFSCLFAPVFIKKESKRDYIVLMLITFLLTLFAFLFGSNEIKRWESIILVILIFFYFAYIIINVKRDNKEELKQEEKESTQNIKMLKPIVLVLLSVAGIALGGELVVYGAKGIALNISDALAIDRNIAETLIGLTIVAVGTSLPELVTTIIASKKGENDMALGNVIGSNIFNIIFVLGISGVIAPFSIASYMIVDLFVLVAATLLVFVFVIKGKLTRKHSIVLISVYALYLIYLILRTIL